MKKKKNPNCLTIPKDVRFDFLDKIIVTSEILGNIGILQCRMKDYKDNKKAVENIGQILECYQKAYELIQGLWDEVLVLRNRNTALIEISLKYMNEKRDIEQIKKDVQATNEMFKNL